MRSSADHTQQPRLAQQHTVQPYHPSAAAAAAAAAAQHHHRSSSARVRPTALSSVTATKLLSPPTPVRAAAAEFAASIAPYSSSHHGSHSGAHNGHHGFPTSGGASTTNGYGYSAGGTAAIAAAGVPISTPLKPGMMTMAFPSSSSRPGSFAAAGAYSGGGGSFGAAADHAGAAGAAEATPPPSHSVRYSTYYSSQVQSGAAINGGASPVSSSSSARMLSFGVGAAGAMPTTTPATMTTTTVMSTPQRSTATIVSSGRFGTGASPVPHAAAPVMASSSASAAATAISQVPRYSAISAASAGMRMISSTAPLTPAGAADITTPVRRNSYTAVGYDAATPPPHTAAASPAAAASSPTASFLTQAVRPNSSNGASGAIALPRALKPLPNVRVAPSTPSSGSHTPRGTRIEVTPAVPTTAPYAQHHQAPHARFGGHAIATTLLPPHPLQHRPLLVLDLDETLVHASIQPPAYYDHHFNVDMGAATPPVPVWVAVRPGAAEFLRDVSALFEVAVFTASIKSYADAVVDALDPYGRFVHHRLYREHCTDVDGVFVKDLSRLGRPLERIAILDNSPHAYGFQPGNAIAILSWFDETSDRELPSLKQLMRGLGQMPQGASVLPLLTEYREWQEVQERRRMLGSGRQF